MSQINKILLVNDTRGAHEYLYRAFVKMGIECNMALFGTGTIQPIDNNLNFDPLRNFGYLGKLSRPFINLLNVRKLENYDVASYVHRISFIDKPHFLRYQDLSFVRDKVRVMSYTGLGCDEISFIADNNKLPYRPCESCLQYDDPSEKCVRIVRPLKTEAVKNLNKYFNCVTSSMVEYDHISEVYNGYINRIPLPLDLSEIPWIPSGKNKNSKVKIIHTPSRAGFKGTEIVLKAIKKLEIIRNDFEFKVISGLPFNDYINEIGEADIIIDQVWSQSPGMNALWLAAMGKVVFSGNTTLAQAYFNFSKDSPIINAHPDPEKLAKDLDSTISSRHRFKSIGENGREYVKNNHDHLVVAKQYIDQWHLSLLQI